MRFPEGSENSLLNLILNLVHTYLQLAACDLNFFASNLFSSDVVYSIQLNLYFQKSAQKMTIDIYFAPKI